MKKTTNKIKTIIMMSCLVSCALGVKAQERAVASVSPFAVWTRQMQEIAGNNKTLKAAYSQLESMRLANSADNVLPAPEAEVAYMFGSPAGVPHRTNVSVVQTLDWGVLTGHRRRQSKAANTVAEATYRLEFQKVMGEVDALLVKMVYSNKLCNELKRRCGHAREIMQMYEKKYNSGDINAIELNKVRLQLSVSEAELQRAQTERSAIEQSLCSLNGGLPIVVTDTVYPSAAVLPSMDSLRTSLQYGAAIQQARSSVSQSEAAVKLAKVEALPELSIGFQGEYIKDNNYSGPSIGLSIPVWGGGKRKVKAARAENIARQENLLAVQQQQASSLELLYRQAKELIATADKLDRELSSVADDSLLRCSLDAGQMSLLNYLLEQSFYYSAHTARLDAERDAQLALSQLRSLMY